MKKDYIEILLTIVAGFFGAVLLLAMLLGEGGRGLANLF